MTTDAVLAEVSARGLALAAREGRLVLRGDRSLFTPALLRVLRWHREEILRRLSAPAVGGEQPIAGSAPAVGGEQPIAGAAEAVA